jgi:hypothetical protein
MMALEIGSLLYLSLYLCVVLGMIEGSTGRKFWHSVVRRWGKLLGGLLAIGFVVQLFTWIGG